MASNTWTTNRNVVSGRDWSTTRCDIPLEEIHEALAGITQASVDSALESLRNTPIPVSTNQEDQA